MKRLLILMLMAVGMPFLLLADQKLTTNELYNQIDEAIGNSPKYVAEYEKKIDKVKQAYHKETKAEQKLMLTLQLYELYKAYENDSALKYIQLCIELADTLHRKDLSGQTRAMMAFQCSTSGLYMESSELLKGINKSDLAREGLTAYYKAQKHLHGELGYYTRVGRLRDNYYAERDHYRDSLLQVADPSSADYLMERESFLVDNNMCEEALKVNDSWMSMVTAGTHDNAIVSWYRHLIYDRMGDKETAKYWLAMSALDDIKCAVMDQASLITLADLLNYDGDLKRSYNYMRFTWDCNNHFNTRVRSWQISPVMTVIEKNYQAAISRNLLLLTIAVIAATVMAVLFLVMFFSVKKQKLRLAEARKDLEAAKEKLEKANSKLQYFNDEIIRYNKDLFEANRKLKEQQMENTK